MIAFAAVPVEGLTIDPKDRATLVAELVDLATWDEFVSGIVPGACFGQSELCNGLFPAEILGLIVSPP